MLLLSTQHNPWFWRLVAALNMERNRRGFGQGDFGLSADGALLVNRNANLLNFNGAGNVVVVARGCSE